MTHLARSVAQARATLVHLSKGRKHTWPTHKEGEPPPAAPVAKPDEAATPTRRDFRGVPVVVDRPKGFVQEGVDAEGKAWRRVYHVDYGHVPGTLGGDGDGLDVFLGGDEVAAEAHWVLQRKADGSFDEYKVMLGFADRASAKAVYLAHVPARYFGSVCSMSVEMMKALLGIEPCEDVAKALAGLRGIVESVQRAEESPVMGAVLDAFDRYLKEGTPMQKPFAGYDDFAACVAAQRAAGKDKDAARAVCGSLQAEAEKAERLGKVLVEREVRLAKAGDSGELRYVLGVVLEPEVVDAQGDVYSADEIRKSAWNYMVNFRNVGLMHKGLVNGKVHLVESYVAPEDMMIGGDAVKRGTWLMGLHFADDELWAKVQAGELTGLSIGGFAKRTEV